MSSLRTKFVILAIIVQFAVLGALITANHLLLEPWFVWRAQDEMAKTFQALQTGTPGELRLPLRRLASETGFRLTLSDDEGRILDSSVPEFSPGNQLSLPKDQWESFQDHRARLQEGSPLFEVIDKEPRGQSVVSAFYRLREGIYFNATMPLGQIRRNVGIASGLFLSVGLGILGLTSVVIILFSGRVVRPIRRLDSLAQSIASRDFRPRYEGKGDDELSHLGHSMNRMSDQLQAALEETESRNRELAARIESQQRFFASVSHEFKTPLGLIRGYGELLKGAAKLKKSDRDQAASIIQDETDRLARLVDDLMVLTRMGMAEFRLKLSRSNLSAVIQKAIERFKEALRPKDLRVEVDLSEDAVADLDEVRFVQALDNIISNAIRHADSHSTIGVALEQTADSWEIQISNRGTNISDEDLGLIFQPFYRVDTHRNRNDGGSGLGLSIVAEILRLHGGTARARKIQDGVTILLRIPKNALT